MTLTQGQGPHTKHPAKLICASLQSHFISPFNSPPHRPGPFDGTGASLTDTQTSDMGSTLKTWGMVNLCSSVNSPHYWALQPAFEKET